MTKVLFLIPYPLNVTPSQRFRFEQYISFLRENKVGCKISPFIDDSTWKIFHQNGYWFKKSWGMFKGIFLRHILLLTVHKYDIIFIHRGVCLIGPAYFEWIISKVLKKKIVYDFDDAIWVNDVSNANEKYSWLKFSNKIKNIISYSNTVIVGNEYLANYALENNQNVKIFPTTIDTTLYNPIQKSHTDKIVIGWSGSVTTNKHFETLNEVLLKITHKYPHVEIAMISSAPLEKQSFKIKFIKWSHQSEITDLSQIDIGIMPLPNDEWAKGKCGLKGLQYMAMEIPTIMSPIGVNTEIIRDGENGFLAQSDEEWLTKLEQLILSEELRKKLGKAGRKTVVEKYSVDANKMNYLNLFRNLV